MFSIIFCDSGVYHINSLDERPSPNPIIKWGLNEIPYLYRSLKIGISSCGKISIKQFPNKLLCFPVLPLVSAL